MFVLDLFCGLGGWSRAFRDRGHRVVGVDIIPPAEVIGDVLALPIDVGCKVDLVLASPPCTEYAREDMPWCKTGASPDRALMAAAFDLVERIRPRWWIIENVRGAACYFPSPTMRFGSRYLWGCFPCLLDVEHSDCYGKTRSIAARRDHGQPHAEASRLRAMIPYKLSKALCLACEVAA